MKLILVNVKKSPHCADKHKESVCVIAMTLQPCEECNKEISSKAASCPHCGASVIIILGAKGANYALQKSFPFSHRAIEWIATRVFRRNKQLK